MVSPRCKIISRSIAMLTCFVIGIHATYAQVLNEVVANPLADDSGCEYVEIRGTPNQALTNHYFVAVEGDTSGNTGRFDLVVDLSASNLGSNGLLAIIAETNTADCAARTWGAPDTSLVLNMAFDTGALENGTTSFLLVQSNDALIEGDDYDSNDDGILDALPVSAMIVDSVAWADDTMGDINYGSVILPLTAGGNNDMATRFPDNDLPNQTDAWYHGDMGGLSSNSLQYDPAEVSNNFPAGGRLTPGLPNAPNGEIFSDGFE